jgi:1,4-alpha-glucan branching enzyme
MGISADILDRRTTRFVLWSPLPQNVPPQLVIGRLRNGNPPTVEDIRRVVLAAAADAVGLFQLDAAACGLEIGAVYHYWFEVDDSRSNVQPAARVMVTDPFATSVDWRVFPSGAADNTQPAAVFRYIAEGRLTDSDPGGESAVFDSPDAPDKLPPNNQIVIYELPTAWALSRSLNEPERAVATFLDVAALVDERISGANFAELSLLDTGKAYLSDLGVNGLELLPPADSFFKREWGYDTSHYLAPDYELGYPEGDLSPTANRDLARLIDACHRKRIRFFIDAVMAFAKEEPYNHIDAPDFCIDDPQDHQDDADAWTSGRADGSRSIRNGFGSTLWRYAKSVTTYDPVSGRSQPVFPARQLMLTYLTRWMRDFRVSGLRMDSVENVANWDFVQSFKDLGRALNNQRWTDAGLNPDAGADARFLVVGEELSLPPALLRQKRLDGLWNEDFQTRIRAAILGESTNNDNFEWTVRKAIDCRIGGVFTDGAQAINYITKHDVEGWRHERLFTMLRDMPDEQIEKRIKLAFVCLMTAVGIPMLLAGEEFADEHDFFDKDGHVTQRGGKQVDPVHFGRLTAGPPDAGDPDPKNNESDNYFGPMRRRIFAYVKTLIKLRTSAPALSVNDTDFLWSDFAEGKRVIVWRRGGSAAAPLIVLANFSDFASAPGTDYVIPTWPGPAPLGKKWVEVTQGRDVDPAFVGREAIFAWEAKVYTYADSGG